MDQRLRDVIDAFDSTTVIASIKNEITGRTLRAVTGNWDPEQRVFAIWASTDDDISGIFEEGQDQGIYLEIEGSYFEVAWIDSEVQYVGKLYYKSDSRGRAESKPYKYMMKCT